MPASCLVFESLVSLAIQTCTAARHAPEGACGGCAARARWARAPRVRRRAGAHGAVRCRTAAGARRGPCGPPEQGQPGSRRARRHGRGWRPGRRRRGRVGVRVRVRGCGVVRVRVAGVPEAGDPASGRRRRRRRGGRAGIGSWRLRQRSHERCQRQQWQCAGPPACCAPACAAWGLTFWASWRVPIAQ